MNARRILATVGLVLAGLVTLGGSATAATCDGTVNVCPDIAPQLGPVVDQIGPNEFDLGGLG